MADALNEPAYVARAVSIALSQLKLVHAVVGGAACRILGSTRATRDADFVVDMSGNDVRNLKALVASTSQAFTFRTALDAVNSTDPPGLRLVGSDIQIEFLPSDSFTWPAPLAEGTIRVSLDGQEVSVLHPAAIVLSKISRVGPNLESTRPATQSKVQSDLSDISFLAPRAMDGLERIWTLYSSDRQKRLRAHLSAAGQRSSAVAAIEAALPLVEDTVEDTASSVTEETAGA